MVQYFYIKYLNEKFAHLPVDPVYEFVELTENYNLNLVCTVSNTRKIAEGNMFPITDIIMSHMIKMDK